ncbi:MAG: ferrous iron transport protein A [Actinomycetia bacterium]|nr:ferrous iron transport protein A [Actinomycetes bacterium]
MRPGSLTVAVAPLRTPLRLVVCLLEPGLRARLSTMGLRRGVRLEVVQRTSGGGRVVSVAGSHIAVDASVAAQLHVHLDEAAKAG